MLPPVTAFRDADYSSVYRDRKWLTIRRDVRILCDEEGLGDPNKKNT